MYLPYACRPDDAVHPRLLDVPAQLCLDICVGVGRQVLRERVDVLVWHERQSEKLAAVGTKVMVPAVGTKVMVPAVGPLQVEFLHPPEDSLCPVKTSA